MSSFNACCCVRAGFSETIPHGDQDIRYHLNTTERPSIGPGEILSPSSLLEEGKGWGDRFAADLRNFPKFINLADQFSFRPA